MTERVLFGPGGATEVKQDQVISRLPTTLRVDRFDSADTYTDGEALAAQTGADDVKTFTFTSPVDLLWVMGIDNTTNDRVCWANPFGGIPANGVGIPCLDRAQQPITVVTSEVKVYAPSGLVVAVWGFRYA